MWLARAPPGQCASVLPTLPTNHPACQVKVLATPSRTSGPGSATLVQRGCASTAVCRCQQGCAAASAASPTHDVEQHVLPAASSGLPGSTLQPAHTRQVAQLLRTQQAAPRLTAAVDLQADNRQQAQRQRQLPQQQGGVADQLRWLHSNGHGTQIVQRDRSQQVQHCFLADPPHLQQHMPGHRQLNMQQQPEPQPQGLQQQQQLQPGLQRQEAGQQHMPLRGRPPPLRQQQGQDSLQDVQQVAVPLPEAAVASQKSAQNVPRQPEQQQQPPSVRPLQPPEITKRIMQRSTLKQLQDLYAAHSSSFNAINLAALLVQLARVEHKQAPAAAGPTGVAGDFAVQVAQQLVPRLVECENARQAANGVWALAVLGCRPSCSLLQSAAQALTAHDGRLLQSSQPQDLANLAWGLAKLQHDPACSLWQHLAAAAQPRLAAFKPGELAMLLWALTDTQQRQHPNHQQQQQQHQQARQRRQQIPEQPRPQRPQQQPQQQPRPVCDREVSWQHSLISINDPRVDQGCDDVLLSQQHAARRLSHADASTSGGSSRPYYSSSSSSSNRRANSNSSRTGISRRLHPPVRPAARDGAVGIDHGSPRTPRRAGGSSNSSSRPGDGLPAMPSTPLEQQLQQLLPALADVAVQQLQRGKQQYRAQECAMLLRACGVLGYQHDGLLTALAAKQQQHFAQGRCNSQDVANSVWALGKLQCVQPQLMAAAADQTAWVQHSSWQELSLVLLGSAASVRQQRLQQVGSSDLLPAAGLWQVAAAEALRRTLQGLAAAEAASLLQAAALILEPVRLSVSQLRERRQQQQQQAQQQQAQQRHGSDDSSSSGGSGALSSKGTATSSGSDVNSSAVSSSLGSMTCSWDSLDDAVAAAPAQARAVTAAVDAALCRLAAEGQLTPQQLGRHVAAMLHSLAVAGGPVSAGLQQLLLSAAAAAAPGMDRQELAMTAWAAAKLFGGKRSSESLTHVVEAVDSAAGPLLCGCSPLQLSMLAWAHGRLWDQGDSLFMHQLAQAAQQQVQQFGPQALSNLTWAFARLRHYDAGLTAAVGRRARAVLLQLSPPELANLTWGLVALRHRQTGLLKALACRAAATCSSWDPKACVKLAVTFCSRGMPTHRYRSLLGALAEAMADKPQRTWARLTPHELVQLAVALAFGRVRQAACTAQLSAQAVAWLPRISLNDLVSLVWALAMLGAPHPALLQAVSTRVAVELQAVGSRQQSSSSPPPAQQHQLLQQQQQPGQYTAEAAASQQQVLSWSRPDAQPPAVQQLLLQGTSLHHAPQACTGAGAGAGASGAQEGCCAGHAGSPLSTVPFAAVVGSRLKTHHLARLAWAYRTFRHADADWYLAAGQLLASDGSSRLACTGGGSNDTSSSSSSSSLSGGRCAQAPGSSSNSSNGPGPQALASGVVPYARISAGLGVDHSNGHHGSFRQDSFHGLQRPVYVPSSPARTTLQQ